MSASNFVYSPILLFFLYRMIEASCDLLDHQTCDEICKTDSYWYGHCNGWDGTDFSCKCYEYKPPLDGKRCVEKQDKCMQICKKKGSGGGFCYPQRDTEFRKERTACECFKELVFTRRRKRDNGKRREAEKERREVDRQRYKITQRVLYKR